MAFFSIIHSYTQGVKLFNRHLNGGKDRVVHVIFPGAPSKLAAYLEHNGSVPITSDDISEHNGDRFLNEYLKVVDALAEINGDNLYWWGTDIASKNRFTSELPSLLNEYVLGLEAINLHSKNNDTSIIFLSPTPNLRSYFFAYAGRRKLDTVDIASAHRPLAIQFYKGLRKIGGLFVGAVKTIHRTHEVRKYDYNSDPAQKNRPAVLIKSFLYPSAFNEDGKFVDPFFGNLPNYIDERYGDEYKVLIVAVAFKDRLECYRKAHKHNDLAVQPLESYLTYSDIVVAFLKLMWFKLCGKFKVPEKIIFWENDVTRLIESCINKWGWSIQLYQYLHMAAGQRIAEQHNLVRGIMTFEGNPWERMFIEGLKRVRTKCQIVGYQHSVVTPASAGYYILPQELKKCPLPDKIFTTGKVPHNILLAKGDYPKERTRVSCALRHNHFSGILATGCKNGNDLNVLVALEGVWDVLPIVSYIFNNAANCRNTNFTIRSHPVLPLNEILIALSLKIEQYPNIRASDEKKAIDDIAKSDAVIYWGTTVALEALMAGKLLIHFNKGQMPSFDPLFDYDGLKWTINKHTDLSAVLKQIRSVSSKTIEVETEKGRQYVLSYFNPVEEHLMKDFLIDNG